MKQKIILLMVILLLFCQNVEPQEYTQKYILDNGMNILLKENKNTNLVVFDLYIKTGTLTEQKEGISYLTTRMLLAGTQDKNREELIDFIEEKGGNYEIKPTTQYEEIRITVPSTSISTALKFLYEIITQPSFDSSEFEKEKKFILDEINQKLDNSQAISDELLYKELFKGTKYANPVEGTEESVNSLTLNEIKNYYDTWYAPNNMILVIAGNINENLLTSIKKTFGKLGKKDLIQIEQHFVEPESKVVKQNKYGNAFYVNIGYKTVPAKHEDTIKLKALHGLLGQGPASRLFYEVREKQGLSYRLETINPTIKDMGMFKISLITRPENLNKTITEVLKQVERLKTEKISDEELKELKTRIKGYYALTHQLSTDQTEYIGLYEIANLGYLWDEQFPTEIDKITSEDIMYAATKYLDNPVITIVGPTKEAEIKMVE